MIFQNAYIGKCKLKNRIIRSATFEGMCDSNGLPQEQYYKLYNKLAEGEIGGIITGFSYISAEGKAMQLGQSGIDSEEKIKYYLPITEAVHSHGGKIFMQLAHTGRQTRSENTGTAVWGVSDKPSQYFGGIPKILSTEQIDELVVKFSQSAYYAKMSGFDGVQLHAAHGYLIHQFLLSSVNNRKDAYAIDASTKIGTAFLNKIVDEVRSLCGEDFPILVKISGSDDYFNNFSNAQYENLIRFLDEKKVDAIEISYGTMDYALNIIRGAIPYKAILKNNPIFKTKNNMYEQILNLFKMTLTRMKIKDFTPTYNIEYAKMAKKLTTVPIISVGGFRIGEEISRFLENGHCDFVSLCRPFICEPDFVLKLKQDISYRSKCTNCNLCAVMCDSGNITRCYWRR